MSIWVKPNGKEIEINDTQDTIDYAKSLGWKEKKAEQPKKNKSKKKIQKKR